MATVLISPSNFQEPAELIAEINESYEEARVVRDDENYKGIEFG